MTIARTAGATPATPVRAPPHRGGVHRGSPPAKLGRARAVGAMVVGALAALVPVSAEAAKNDGGPVAFDKAEAVDVSRRLATEPRLLRSLATCPADTFERERPWWRRLAKPRPPLTRTCTAHPAACYDLCVSWFNAPACFELALVFERHRGDVADALDPQRLFALACASGYAAGCTNRAAGLRNGDYAGDPFHDAPLATREACEVRSFRIDCDRGGAWGCAMLGQAYRNGEGVAAQAAPARIALEAACKPDPNFAACLFAKNLLRKMDRPDRPEAGPSRE